MRGKVSRLTVLAVGALTAGQAAAAPPADPPLTALSQAVGRVEAVQMLSAILRGEPVGHGTGWFHPAEGRYNWKWLAGRMDANHDGAVTPEEFAGPRELFDRLDRDRDGRLTSDDFDWSDASPYWRQMSMARQLLRRGDADGDGKLSVEEWQALFKKAAKGGDRATADDLRALLFPPAPLPTLPPRLGEGKSGGPPSDMPSRRTLLSGFFKGEIGSPSIGPSIGMPAPDFTLRTPDGKEISLRGCRGDRPMVLVFGSFT